MENSNCNTDTIIPVTKTEVSGEPQSHDSRDNVFPSESTDSIAEDDVNDVKVCDICGDIGYEEVLVTCAKCNEGAEPIYCMQTLLTAVPTEDWFCEGCKLKQKESNQKKLEAITESKTVSSSGQVTGKQGICRNSSSNISGLGKLNISSEKMQMQNSAKNPESPCKQQLGDSLGAPVRKKQTIECGNLAVNVCQPALQRNNSLKAHETIKADGCGVLPQIKSPVRPSFTRDGSFKMPEAGKSDNGTTSLPAYNNSTPRPFSRENSFKTAETGKVKFLPSHSVAGLRSGVPLKASSKSNVVDENSNVATPRTGIVNSWSFSPRNISSPKSVEFLSHPSPFVTVPALRTVGNIVTGDDARTQAAIDNGALPRILHLLTVQPTKKTITKEVCWTISNITAGTRSQVQAVINAKIFPPLINLLANAEFDIKKEAAWAVSNATSGGNDEQIKYLVSQGCIQPLCDLLTCPDARIITVCLEGLENILRAGEAEKMEGVTEANAYVTLIEEAGGLDKIEDLQSHENTEVYEKAVKILENFLAEDDMEEMLAMPDNLQGAAFGFSTDKKLEIPPGGFNFL